MAFSNDNTRIRQRLSCTPGLGWQLITFNRVHREDFSVSATAGPLMCYSAYNRYDWGLAACIALTMILIITVLVSVYT